MTFSILTIAYVIAKIRCNRPKNRCCVCSKVIKGLEMTCDEECELVYLGDIIYSYGLLNPNSNYLFIKDKEEVKK